MKLITILTIATLACLTTQKCPSSATEKCLSCDTTTCKTCVGLKPNTTGTCEAVTTAKSNCVAYNADSSCKACNTGYSLVSAACVKNTVTDCSIGFLGDAAKCYACKDEYVPSADNTKCEKGTCSISNCYSCARNGTTQQCGLCKSGYALNDAQTTCTASDVKGCWESSSKTACTKCQYGYHTNGSNGCVDGKYTQTYFDEVDGAALMGLVSMIFAISF